MGCLFCKIISGEIPSSKVYEDENSVVFLDINPVNTGHILLVPKEHSRNIFDVKEETLKNLMPVLKKISMAVKEGVNADGVNVHINNEPTAGQVIFHTHLHIIPRFEDDGLKLWQGEPYGGDKMEKVAGEIKSNLN